MFFDDELTGTPVERVMSKPKILLQIDSDQHPSVFDSIVAIDAGVDHLLRHQGVEPTQVRDLVHGAMFTRGPGDLHNTAIFVGGSNVSAGERLLACAVDCFFGPMRVSVMMDSNGANTTAAAAVLAAEKHVDLKNATVLVLAATGPVGQRVVRLLAREGAHVRVGSRSIERAEGVCREVQAKVGAASLQPVAVSSEADIRQALDGVRVVFAAGAAGIQLLSANLWQSRDNLAVAIDLNAVPPAGIESIAITDKAVERNGVICYGAIGVGAAKMKIHKAAIKRLFQSNDQVLDAEQIFAIGRELASNESSHQASSAPVA